MVFLSTLVCQLIAITIWWSCNYEQWDANEIIKLENFQYSTQNARVVFGFQVFYIRKCAAKFNWNSHSENGVKKHFP